MDELVLVIADKNESSWSLRPWLVLTEAGIPFREEIHLFDAPGWQEQIRALTPAGKVPVLCHGALRIWESLAICEYAAELAPEQHLWPEEREARARARALCCEMLAGFSALRTECPMNLGLHKTAHALTAAGEADVRRVEELVEDCLRRSRGPFLFGRFGIVDAMYAPVTTRFKSYGLPLRGAMADFTAAIYALGAMRCWLEGARAEVGELTKG